MFWDVKEVDAWKVGGHSFASLNGVDGREIGVDDGLEERWY